MTHDDPHAVHADRLWQEKNRAFLARHDEHAAAGNPVGAWLALAAFAREEEVRLRIKAWEIEHGLYDGWASRWPRVVAP